MCVCGYVYVFVCVCTRMLVCLGIKLGFIHTLEIITRILSEVANRERLCGNSSLRWVVSARWVAVRPLEEVPTQSNFVCLLDSKMVR